jgi:hypothetical protein
MGNMQEINIAQPVNAIFDDNSKDAFARNYPEQGHLLEHNMASHPLMERAALAELSQRLPSNSIEYNRGDIAIGADGNADITNGMSIADTICDIENAQSWAVLKNIEQDPAYAALLQDLLAHIQPQIEAKTGPMLTPQGYIFISSPNAVTPYHFDPEHNILLQLQGEKWMTQYQPGDERYAPAPCHEAYHLGAGRNLPWDDIFLEDGHVCHLTPGKAVYVPVMAPHFVRNGAMPSVSLSITWRSKWSYNEADARAFNALLRKCGLSPAATQRFPQNNGLKAKGWKLARKAPALTRWVRTG